MLAMKRLIATGLLSVVYIQLTFTQSSIDTTTLLYPENIIKITFNNNNRIKSAYYELEAAKYNFKLFESEYTQFNPLIVAPKMHMNSNGQYTTDVVAGMQKEFFNGASISTAIGNNNAWGNGVELGNINFIETEIFLQISKQKNKGFHVKRTGSKSKLAFIICKINYT